MIKTTSVDNDNTNSEINHLNFFHTPYFYSNPTTTEPNDGAETESEDGTNELSFMKGTEKDASDDESLGNPSEETNETCTNKDWIAAMNIKMEALHKNNTWEVSNLPPGKKPIGCKWVYKIKYKSYGEIDRYKAILVAKGYNQREGIDFDETFSPVVKITTVKCLINMAINNNWPLCQLDVNNAFFYGNLNEEVYMTLPPSYFSVNDNRVCRLIKSLYGLKQAPRQWNEMLRIILLEKGSLEYIPRLNTSESNTYTLKNSSFKKRSLPHFPNVPHTFLQDKD
ncbi:putative RNA-directed DNA polymerase, partial [Tanacetum coccineum]